jgi:hypothetical protein
MKLWVNTVSRSHVERGVDGGFTQANHGSAANLKRLTKGDRIVFYAPRTDYPKGEPLQQFVALGEITDDAPYQAEMTPDFHPWRRNVHFFRAADAAIAPLVDSLDFIPDKQRWGFPFRRGLFEIGADDFMRIVDAMGAAL